MKKQYSAPEITIIDIKTVDVLTGSEYINDPDVHEYSSTSSYVDLDSEGL